MTGHPAASVPVGFTSGGLPVGLQIVGKRQDDATVLRLAAAYEAAFPWAQHRPEFA
jgi:Asp-tRNA(Asn)/Glu-tRNA(Gln) amidotransferase A subunit family amidase